MAYGGSGDDTFFVDDQFKSTLVGGTGFDFIDVDNSTALTAYGSTPESSIYGNDTISLLNAAASTVYGGQGDDSIYSFDATGNTLYGGGGNDSISAEFSNAEVLYGNQGDDSLNATAVALTAYGGQGDDTVEQFFSAGGVLYGNKGNDVVLDFVGTGDVEAGAGEGSSVLYGGAGDDTLVAFEAGGDSMACGQGDNLFAMNDDIDPEDFTVNSLITVEDFVTGNDRLLMSSSVNGSGNLTKENDLFANNANDAVSFADAFYSTHSGPEYLFIYGGAGAGYLFYNDDGGGTLPNDGMILLGDNAESSLSANDIHI